MAVKAGSGSQTPAHVKAHTTGRWAEIIFRVLGAHVAKRWRFISFRGTGDGEARGVVDLLAIRKNMAEPRSAVLKRGDLFDIVLVQVKGGAAKDPTGADRRRLHRVAKHYRATGIVLFRWRKGRTADFSLLQPDLKWRRSSGAGIFG